VGRECGLERPTPAVRQGLTTRGPFETLARKTLRLGLTVNVVFICCVGAGSGATVGTGDFYGGLRMKSGIGTASIRVGEFVIGAIAAVNATGDVVE